MAGVAPRASWPARVGCAAAALAAYGYQLWASLLLAAFVGDASAWPAPAGAALSALLTMPLLGGGGGGGEGDGGGAGPAALGSVSVKTAPLVRKAVLADLGLLVLFGVQHSLMARRGFKRLVTSHIVPPALVRSFYVVRVRPPARAAATRAR